MSCLFICNRALSESDCQVLMELLTAEDGLLLIEDGCYLIRSQVLSDTDKKYVLKPDLQTRGLGCNQSSFTLLDSYSDMVELTLSFDKTLTWT